MGSVEPMLRVTRFAARLVSLMLKIAAGLAVKEI
jgi:hypothetical protein